MGFPHFQEPERLAAKYLGSSFLEAREDPLGPERSGAQDCDILVQLFGYGQKVGSLGTVEVCYWDS